VKREFTLHVSKITIEVVILSLILTNWHYKINVADIKFLASHLPVEMNMVNGCQNGKK